MSDNALDEMDVCLTFNSHSLTTSGDFKKFQQRGL